MNGFLYNRIATEQIFLRYEIVMPIVLLSMQRCDTESTIIRSCRCEKIRNSLQITYFNSALELCILANLANFSVDMSPWYICLVYLPANQVWEYFVFKLRLCVFCRVNWAIVFSKNIVKTGDYVTLIKKLAIWI